MDPKPPNSAPPVQVEGGEIDTDAPAAPDSGGNGGGVEGVEPEPRDGGMIGEG